MRLCLALRSVALWAVMALLVGGCASIGGGGSKPPEQLVVERAQARWDALLRRDWPKAHQYLVPAYRSIVPVESYGFRFSGPLQWESAQVRSAKCEEKRCLVDVEVTVRLLLPGHLQNQVPTNLEEVWVLEDGQWFKFETP